MSSNETLNSTTDSKTSKNDLPGGGLWEKEGTETQEPQILRKTKKNTTGIVHPDNRRELSEEDCYDKLGFSFPWYKKWWIISVIFLVQLSMNFNASVYASGTKLFEEHFEIGEPAVKVGQMLFLVAYAFGCELWAPWSEDYGRWPIMQLSLFFVNIWQILAALAPNLGSLYVARFLGGLSSAGGSVTLGMCADMWDPQNQGFAVAYVVLSSVGGSTLGPIFGGIMTEKLNWRWNFWMQLIVGGVTQLIHFFLVTETRTSILVDREAKRRRESGEDPDIYGPGDFKNGLDMKEILSIWSRPFIMFVKEPIVLFLSLLSGFSDALIFICMESVPMAFELWGFNTITQGLVFCSVLIGYFIAYFLHLGDIKRQNQILLTQGDAARLPERRLLLLLFLVVLEPVGLFGFAWSSMGPQHNHWMGPIVFLALIGIANYSIYMSTIDYMILAYQSDYAASATGGNGFARDLLAGIAAMYSGPMFRHFSKTKSLQWANTFLGFVAILVALPVYIFYWKGPQIRAKSKFASTLAADKKLRKDKTLMHFDENEEEIGVEDLKAVEENKGGKPAPEDVL